MQPVTLALEARSLWGVWEGAMRRARSGEEMMRLAWEFRQIRILAALVSNCGILNCLALLLKCGFPLL